MFLQQQPQQQTQESKRIIKHAALGITVICTQDFTLNVAKSTLVAAAVAADARATNAHIEEKIEHTRTMPMLKVTLL